MDGKVKLPQDLITCAEPELKAYIDSHLPGGHKRKLAEAVLALRISVKFQKEQLEKAGKSAKKAA